MPVDQLKYANVNYNLTGSELMVKFLNDGKMSVRDSEGNFTNMAVTEFYSFASDKFIKTLEYFVGNTEFIRQAVANASINIGHIPLLSLIYDDGGEVTKERVKDKMDVCGIPHIYTETGSDIFPENTSTKGEIAKEVPSLFIYNKFFTFITNRNPINFCPLLHYCAIREKVEDVVKDECRETPWFGRECMMTQVARQLHIDNVKV